MDEPGKHTAKPSTEKHDLTYMRDHELIEAESGMVMVGEFFCQGHKISVGRDKFKRSTVQNGKES
jgi:hypothetical protein